LDGWVVARRTPTSPRFSPAFPTETFLNSPTLISTHNEHLSLGVIAQTTNTQGVEVGGINANCGDTILSDNMRVYKSEEDAQITRLLAPLEPNNEHQGVHSSRFDGVGDWLFETRELVY